MCIVYGVIEIFIPSGVSSGGGPAAHGFAGTSDHASIPSVVWSRGDPAAHGFAGTPDHAFIALAYFRLTFRKQSNILFLSMFIYNYRK
jgi:hypothetical protein